MLSSINGLPANSIRVDGITETNDNQSHRDDDDSHVMDPPNQHSVSNFSPDLIADSRSSNEPHKRVKRVQVFRPLFVYRQEQIQRKRIIERRNQRSQKPNINTNRPNDRQTTKPCTCCEKCPRY